MEKTDKRKNNPGPKRRIDEMERVIPFTIFPKRKLIHGKNISKLKELLLNHLYNESNKL